MRFTYCPRCGSRLTLRELGDDGLTPFCQPCGTPWWDSFTTSVICAVVSGGEVALLRQDYVSESHYVCVAGVMKPGESAEDAARREVREELGLDVTDLRFVETFPYERKEMLMIGFTAQVERRDFTLSREVDSARWFPFDEALAHMREGSVAWRLVRASIRG